MRKKSVLLLVLLIMVLTLVGCGEGSDTSKMIPDNDGISRLNMIEENDVLVYDIDTKIVYYYFSYRLSTAGYGYMSPYLSENGNFCKYDVETQQIIEIQK